MKIGDKIYCKKTLSSDYKVYYTKNKIYYITDIDNFDIYIKSEDNKSIRFSLKPKNEDNFKIQNFFCSENDYRKLKLLKLNENRR